MRKGKWSTIRYKAKYRAKSKYKSADGYGRKATAKRMKKLAEYEAEKERKPKIKRNGIIIN